MLWRVDYVVGNYYKAKYVRASNAADAIKQARVKNIEDLNPIEDGEAIKVIYNTFYALFPDMILETDIIRLTEQLSLCDFELNEEECTISYHFLYNYKPLMSDAGTRLVGFYNLSNSHVTSSSNVIELFEPDEDKQIIPEDTKYALAVVGQVYVVNWKRQE